MVVGSSISFPPPQHIQDAEGFVEAGPQSTPAHEVLGHPTGHILRKPHVVVPALQFQCVDEAHVDFKG